MFNPYAGMPAFPGAPPMMMPFLPGQKIARRPNRAPPTEPQATLYVRNLNEKLKVEVLKKGLEAVFGSFGKIVDIKVKRHLRHRGQAFVRQVLAVSHRSFENKEIATTAMQRSQGFQLFEKPMDIQYALEPSFSVSALAGNEQLESHKRKRQEQAAFVEYDTELESAVAKQSLHGYRLGDKEMKVTFARRG
ncbi:hypothetical protein HDU91_002807 [Kappamyces sp. JEL0680]|nr:hypothetical protein HDU91_002807 [Kappamyces sp. JEL0680]